MVREVHIQTDFDFLMSFFHIEFSKVKKLMRKSKIVVQNSNILMSFLHIEF